MNYKKKLLMIISFFMLTGCKEKAPMKGNKEIIIKTHDKINFKLALKMYIVLIYTKEAAEIMKNIDTQTFFRTKDQLLLDNPYELVIWEKDLINNSVPKCIIVPSCKRFWGLVIFFKYSDNSESKITYPSKERSIVIKLNNNTFEIERISKRQVIKDNPILKKNFSETLPDNKKK